MMPLGKHCLFASVQLRPQRVLPGAAAFGAGVGDDVAVVGARVPEVGAKVPLVHVVSQNSPKAGVCLLAPTRTQVGFFLIVIALGSAGPTVPVIFISKQFI